MPLSTAYNHILNTILFNQIAGIDIQARAATNALLAYSGLDDTSNVYDTSASDLSVIKLRSLFSSDTARALLADVEATDGQLNKISIFLRKVQSGACARFLVDHDSNNIEHLRHFVKGSSDVHSFSDEFTPYIFDNTLASTLKLTDAASFRNAIIYVRSNLPQLAYLLNPLPVDTYSKIGKKKDDNIHQFWTLLITASNLNKTFSLGIVNRSGHALGFEAREYFLSDTDIQNEILTLNTEFANVKMTNGVAAVIERISGIISSLSELGKPTTNIEFYTKLWTLLSDNGGYLQNICVTFKILHSPPNEDETLNNFRTLITNDKKAMAIGVSENSKNEGVAKVDANTVEAKKLNKKALKAANKKAYRVAMNAISVTETSASSSSAPSKACINYVAKLKTFWNDETVGMHSDLNKIWNANTTNGTVDYPGFLAQLQKEHNQGKNASPSPPTAPRKNQNLEFTDSLQTSVRRCETDDSIKAESSVRVNNPDEFAAQEFSADSDDTKTSAL